MRNNQNSDTPVHALMNRFTFRLPTFLQDPTGRFFFLFSFFIHGILWGILFWFVGIDENMAVLRYNAYFGIDLTGSSRQIFFLPFVSLIFFLINTILASIFFQKGDRFSALLLLVSSFFVQIGSAISVLALVLVN